MNFIVKTGSEIKTADINAIYKLLDWHVYTDEAWRKMIQKSTFVVQVLYDNQTIGFARTVDDSRMCMIYDLVVHPDFQKKGVGTLLMQEIMEYVSKNDFEWVSLFYWNENEQSSKLYEKFGFQKVSTGMVLRK